MGLTNTALLIAMLAAVLAILYATGLIIWVIKLPTGNAKMQEIAKAIQQGARAYLTRQYTTIAIVAVLLAVLLYLTLGLNTALGFLVGAILSGLAGVIGMNVSVQANVRTAEAANHGMARALNVAFKGG